MSDLSKIGLNAKIIVEKEDADFEDGFILDQIPRANTKIRHSFPIGLTVSKKPALKTVENFVGMNVKDLEFISKHKGFVTKAIRVASQLPKDYCIAQFPQCGEPINTHVEAYISDGEKPYYIVPNFVGQNASNIQDELLKNGLRVDMYHKTDVDDGHVCRRCSILEQKPMAGSIVDTSNKFKMQLLVGI